MLNYSKERATTVPSFKCNAIRARMMNFLASRNLMAFVGCTLLVGCADSKQDFCKYLTVEEARSFDSNIVVSEMRQTKGLLYCVWGDGKSDKLFISLDRAIDHSLSDFLKVVAKNSPEANQKVISVSGVGNEAAALFLGDDGRMALEFFISQNSKYSITIRAPDVNSVDSKKFSRLKEIADMILPRIQ